MATLKAYCYRSGELTFTPEEGTVKLGQKPDDWKDTPQEWKEAIGISCRLAYDNKTWLIPDVPEAEEALEAVARFIKRMKRCNKFKQKG